MYFLDTISGLSGETLVSAVLKYLLLNSGQFRALFVERIPQSVAPSNIPLFRNGIQCQTEVAFPEGRVDLLIRADNVILGVENKLWAALQEGQPKRYDDGREVTVPTMHLNDARLNYAEEDGVKILQLPYSNGEGIDLSMLLVLPDTPAGWSELDRQLSSKLLNKWESKLDARIVDVSLPRFRIQSPAQLAGSLTDLGMPLAFDTAQADFSGVSSEPLFLREVVHEAIISVDEEGTVAAAATGPVMEFVSDPPPATFKADRPFLFLIRDHRTSAILFLGRVENPNSKADN